MPHVVVPSGSSLHYNLYGDGEEKIILVIGFGCCKTYWHPQIDQLLELGKIQTNQSSLPPSSPTSPSSPSSPFSPSSPLSPISPCSPSGSVRSNRYQICAFDARGFGQSTYGDIRVKISTQSMAIDTAALLLHLKWIHSSSEPSFSFSTSPSRSSRRPPILHIIGWSLGGMITQELCLILSRPSSFTPAAPNYSHRLTSFILIGSSPGGLRNIGTRVEEHDSASSSSASHPKSRSKSRGPLSSSTSPSRSRETNGFSVSRWLSSGVESSAGVQLLRNLPPLSAGIPLVLRVLFGSITTPQRICHVANLHYSQHYLNQKNSQKSFIRSLATTAPVQPSIENVDPSPPTGLYDFDRLKSASLEVVLPMPVPSSIITNRDLIHDLYLHRAPFDRHFIYYLPALFGHVCAVAFHHCSYERLKLLRNHSDSTHPSPSSSSSSSSVVGFESLVLHGTDDILVNPYNSVLLAQGLACTLMKFKNSGHMIHTERPELIAKIMHRHMTASAKKRREKEKETQMEDEMNQELDEQIQQEGNENPVEYQDDLITIVDFSRANSILGSNENETFEHQGGDCLTVEASTASSSRHGSKSMSLFSPFTSMLTQSKWIRDLTAESRGMIGSFLPKLMDSR